jgi:hypothetical protein
VAIDVRGRLQVVAGLVPEDGRAEYLRGLRGNAHTLFEGLYDPIQPGEPLEGQFNFEETDDDAPHSPLEIRWNRSFATLTSLHGRLVEIDGDAVHHIFGDLIKFLITWVPLDE